MRLLSTSLPAEGEAELRLEEFFGNRIPPYAILSHTWSDANQEVQFSDLQHASYQHKSGVVKVRGALRQARKNGHKYLWIDSICIDKSSSSELSEAINSMFKWYQNSKICYVYLSDVHAQIPDSKDFHADSEEFGLSRWWTRGWTLQELIAPKSVTFFTAEWQMLGDRAMLQSAITAITKIEPEFLLGSQQLSSASVAKRMSWAASRVTTREEDVAYCLLGLFSVQMPMLYGEGKQAFVRLQEEIIKSTDDHTIFTWQTDESVDTHGLLAESPLAFAASSECSSPRTWMKATPFAMTNMGLRIELPLLPVMPVEVDDRTSEPTFDAILPCTLPSNPNKFVAIRVRALPGLTNKWNRIECHKFYYKDSISWPMELYFPQSISDTTMTSETPSIYEIVRLRSFAIDNPGLSGTFQHLHIWRVAIENVPKIAGSGAFRQFDQSRIPATQQLLHQALGRAGSNSGQNDNQFCVVGTARGRVYGWFILERVSNATEVMVIVGRHMTGQIGFGVLWCLHRPSGRSPLEQDLCQLQLAGSWMDMEVYCEADDTSWSRSNLERRVAANRVRRVPLRRAKVDMHSEPHGRFYDFSVQLA